MIRYTIQDLGSLRLTRSVSCSRGGRWSCVQLLNDGHLDPIITVADEAGLVYILDGNQRACCCQRHSLPLDALQLQCDGDHETLLELENSGSIRPFPHRAFMMGRATLEEMLQDSQRASAALGRLTVAEANDAVEAADDE